MQLAHRVALNGAQLDEIDNRIIISRVETGDGKMNISMVSLPGDGSRVTGMSRDSIDIIVRFRLRFKKRRMEEREELLERINAWACGGGWLTANYKPNRRIRVFLAQAATAGDPWEWTKDYQLIFRACGVPYWQQESPTSLMRQGVSSGTFTFGVDGSAQSVMEVSFRNTSGSTINTFSINTGESAMAFSGLGLANGETLIIDHDDTGKKCVLRLSIANAGGVRRSIMDKRTGDDDLLMTPDSHEVVFSAGGAGRITISCCGRFA